MQHTIQAIIFKKEKGKYKFLLLRRIPSRGGFYQPITGRCEKGETYLQAAKREVLEETGIKRFKKTIKDFYEFDHENLKTKEIAFGFEVDNRTEPDLKVNIYPEHDDSKWCSLTQALKLFKWSQNKIALKKLNKKLKRL